MSSTEELSMRSDDEPLSLPTSLEEQLTALCLFESTATQAVVGSARAMEPEIHQALQFLRLNLDAVLHYRERHRKEASVPPAVIHCLRVTKELSEDVQNLLRV